VNAADVWGEIALHARRHPEDAELALRFRALLHDTPAPFSRDQYQPGHLTCSACVLSRDGGHVLLLHHVRLGRWLQPGGHAEPGDDTPSAGALREVREESGLAELAPLAAPGGSALVDLDIHAIPARGAEPEHLHFDLRYAFASHLDAELRRSSESHALRWIEIERLGELTAEESVRRLVERARARLHVESVMTGPGRARA
jgi:8-oxo-dGTP pyrophosphatase MutT (NUDIX family)